MFSKQFEKDYVFMSLLKSTGVYKPFQYPWAYDYWQMQQQVHWLPEEVPLHDDCRDWNQRLEPSEKNLLTQIFRFFTQADIDVMDCYHEKYSRVFKPTEIKMMLTAFSNIETVHVAGYSHLLDTVGMPETEYSAFMQIKSMRDKHDYMSQFGVNTDEDIAKTLAMFGGFTEGVQLFASFAMLMNFPRFKKMKGMGQIISWSVRDECVSDDTEVLTPKGWVKFPELSDTDQVMQYDPSNRDLSFVTPDRVVRKPYKGDLIVHKKRQFDIACTPNHDILHTKNFTNSNEDFVKTKASEFSPHHRYAIPVGGNYTAGSMYELTALERLKIAYAADGASISSENRTGEKVGYNRVVFYLKKQRKIDRIFYLAKHAGVTIDELESPNRTSRKFAVNIPTGHASKSMSTWANLSEMTSSYARAFIDEVLQWDGHVKYDRRTFCSTNKDDIDLLQAVAVIAGYSTTITISEDDRKESYKTYYRLSFWYNQTTPSRGELEPSKIAYDGMVYCVSVPTGCFLIRRNGVVHVTGNSLHSEGIIRLFHEFCRERGCLTSSVRKDILEMCLKTVEIEDAFIDTVFEMGPVNGMTPSDIKKYIRFIADWRLSQLGFDPIYRIEEHPIPWLIPLLNGVEHTNFFEQRATAYSKNATKGNWTDVWNMFDKTQNTIQTDMMD